MLLYTIKISDAYEKHAMEGVYAVGRWAVNVAVKLRLVPQLIQPQTHKWTGNRLTRQFTL